MPSASQPDSKAGNYVQQWDDYDLDILDRIQRRVLWLSTYMVHYANFIRPNPDGIKIGGHEASSSSVLTLLTALYFYFLRSGDRVSIKPHASPVFHAIQFLRGLLPQEKLKTFRQYGGIQAYPSRTKDVDGVDFSTGSVGLGAVAPIFGALVRDYLCDHFEQEGSGFSKFGWHIALVGDAELDEGNEKQPVVILAYTIKGWGLPFAGNPANHASLLKPAQIETLRQQLGIPTGDEFSGFSVDSEEAQYIRERLEEGEWVNGQAARSARLPIEIPPALGGTYQGALSTQAALGRIFLALSRDPRVAPYLVTASPDVATSTNLGGWIHKVGVYSRREVKNYFREQGISLLVDWRETPQGSHIELGISENNLFLLLGTLGLAGDLYGQPLLPVGTVYDPFVCRALDAFIYAAYSQAKFIVVGTPSGISLSSEGGAHQSIITPGIGLQLPGVTCYEPAFALELEWILLHALSALQNREQGKSAYLRLSTKPLDQSLFNVLLERRTEDDLRHDVLKGGYRLVDCREEQGYQAGHNVVHLFVSGAMVPEAVAAAHQLRAQRIFANVFNVTSSDLLFHDYLAVQQGKIRGRRCQSWMEGLVSPPERAAPVVTVHDAHPHTLSFIGGALSTRMINLGVTEFGQSGSQAELYQRYGIAQEDIVAAATWMVESR